MIVSTLLASNAGELSPRLNSRTDYEKYFSGCRTLENFISTPHGPCMRRPGTEIIFDAPIGEGDGLAGKLVTMQISTDVHIVLVLANGKAYVTCNGAPVLDEGDQVSFDIPWSNDELPLLKYKQINDVVFMVHPDHRRYKLSRMTADNITWDLSPIPEDQYCPTLPLNTNEYLTLDVDFPVAADATAWTGSSHTYSPGDKVTYSGKTYTCDGTHISTALNHPLSGATYTKAIQTGMNGFRPVYTYVTLPIWLENFVDKSCAPDTVLTLTSPAEDFFQAGHINSVWRLESSRPDGSYEATIAATSANNNLYSPVIVVQGPWDMSTNGTWYGTFLVMISEDRGVTWKEHRRVTSTSAAPRNAELSGVTDKRVLMRMQWLHTADGSGSPYAIISSGDARLHGHVRVTAVNGTGTVATCVAITPVEYGKTSHWAEPVWSEYRGYPRCVELHQGRIVYAGSYMDPHMIVGSRIDNYDDFMPGELSESSGPYQHTLVIGEKDPIAWMQSDRLLVIGSGSAEFVVYGQTEQAAIVPQYGTARRQSSMGCDDSGPCAIPSETVPLFIQRGGDRIHEMNYMYDDDRFVPDNLCLNANHIHRNKRIVAIALMRMPFQILWVVDDSGKLAGYTYERRHNVTGWHRHTTSDTMLDVAVCRGSDTEDHVYFLCKDAYRLSLMRFGRGCMIDSTSDKLWIDGAVTLPDSDDLSPASRYEFRDVIAVWDRFWFTGTWNSSAWLLFTHVMVDAGTNALSGRYFVAGTYDGYYRLVKLGTEDSNTVAMVKNGDRIVIYSNGQPVAYVGTTDSIEPDGVITDYNTGTPIGNLRLGTGFPGVLGREVLWANAGAHIWSPNTIDMSGKPVYRCPGLSRTMQRETLDSIEKWSQRGYDGTLLFKATTGATDVTSVSWTNVATGQPASGQFEYVTSLWSSDPGTEIKVGVAYDSTYMPMPLYLPLGNGSSRTREARVVRIAVDLEESYGGAAGPNAQSLLPLHEDTVPHTGEVEISVANGYDLNGDVMVVASMPRPFILRALSVKWNVYGDNT